MQEENSLFEKEKLYFYHMSSSVYVESEAERHLVPDVLNSHFLRKRYHFNLYPVQICVCHCYWNSSRSSECEPCITVGGWVLVQVLLMWVRKEKCVLLTIQDVLLALRKPLREKNQINLCQL